MSWHVSDTSHVIAKHIAKTNNEKTRDKGALGLFQDMIQTWVTFELVKVINIFGLSPAYASHIEAFAPDLYNYFFYIQDTSQNKGFENKANNVQQQLMKHSLHSNVFDKCSFMTVEKESWTNHVNCMIPVVVLSWLRQLKEYFFLDNNGDKSWAKLGNYVATGNLDNKHHPLTSIYFKHQTNDDLL